MNISTKQEPPLIQGHFLFGHLFQVKNEGIKFYERMARENGDAFRLKILHKTYYLFLHPDYNKEILADKSDIFVKGTQYNSLRLILGNGLLTSEGAQWAKQRKILNPLFGKEGMNVLLKHITAVSAAKVTGLKTGEVMDCSKLMFNYTIEVAIRSFFGTSLNEELIEQFNRTSINCIRTISRRMANVYSLPLFVPTAENREFKKSLIFLKNTVSDIYQSRIAREKNQNDMLDMLIAAQDDDSSKLSLDEIFDQILTFLFAGHETTAISMTWLFYSLAQNPAIQQKIIAECEANDFQFESSLSLGNYPYLTTVINETLRLYPAGWVIARDINADSTVGNFKVKKGSVIAVSPYLSQRDPRWWKNPLEFNPDRFTDDTVKNAFLPFSLGKRNCIGARFAMIEMAVFCVHFFKHYTVSSETENVGVKGYVTLKPDRPISISINKRKA